MAGMAVGAEAVRVERGMVGMAGMAVGRTIMRRRQRHSVVWLLMSARVFPKLAISTLLTKLRQPTRAKW